ncbi:MAG: hypothetical protein JXN60_06635, partial [Lentisphaerae bacterium]|nr:hypothetical protein [Lentisphaerota bacterium]
MRSIRLCIGLVAVYLCGVCLVHAESSVRIGAGAHYWKSLSDIADQLKQDTTRDVVESSIAWVGIVQFRPASLIGLEGAVEMLPDGIGV